MGRTFQIQTFRNKDVFSLGLITIYCIDTEEYLKQQKTINNDENAMEQYLNGLRLRMNKPALYYLIRCMLSFSPKTRPTVKQIFEDYLVMNGMDNANENKSVGKILFILSS